MSVDHLESMPIAWLDVIINSVTKLSIKAMWSIAWVNLVDGSFEYDRLFIVTVQRMCMHTSIHFIRLCGRLVSRLYGPRIKRSSDLCTCMYWFCFQINSVNHMQGVTTLSKQNENAKKWQRSAAYKFFALGQRRIRSMQHLFGVGC